MSLPIFRLSLEVEDEDSTGRDKPCPYSSMATANRIETSLQQGYANVNGIRSHYAESGSGNDLVILLHGFPEFWYSWRHQLPVLGERYHVVAPDMRGYNLSDKPPRVEDYRVDVLVDDVIGFINHFGAERAAIVAHDWGAGVAWKVAEKHPERVSKLAILQVPPASAWRANITLAQLLRSWYMFLFQLPRFPEWLIARKNFATLDKMFTESVARKHTFTDADIKLYKEALARPGALTAALNYYRANVRPMMSKARSKKRHERAILSRTSPGETSEPNAGIRVPTLFIYGEQDVALVPATVRGIERFINAPYTELRIADSGHWVQNEAAAEVNAALLDFLNTN